jgi:phenylacetate-CoA ligase
MESLYFKFPVFLQNIACSIEGYRIKRRRFGGNFDSVRRKIENRLQVSHDELCEFRDIRLRKFLRYSYETVPYYRQLFLNNDIHPHDMQSLNDLKKLPLLTREVVQKNRIHLLSNAIPRNQWRYTQTSGSTGAGVIVANSRDASHELWAVCFRYRRWHGLEPGTWSGHFGGKPVVPSNQKRPPYWRYNLPGKQVLFSAYHLNENNLKYYVNELKRRKLPWLHGYPSLLSLVATYVVDKKIDLGYQISWVTIGSENLLPQQTEVIQKAFGVRPRQHYAMTEMAANISECERGKLHVDEDFAAVEFIPINGGDTCKIVGTNLSNLAMPLIRYDIQDNAQIDPNDSCDCGKPGRIVKSIDGRKEDYIILKDGTIHGRTAFIFKYMVNIREAQIYQHEPGKITIRIVKGEHYTNTDEKFLIEKLHERFNSNLDFDIQYVPELTRTRTGKLRFVISDIDKGKLSLE